MRSPLAVKLVLFDLDGTVVDSAPDLAHAANLMLQELGRTEQPANRIAAWIGDGMIRLVKRALTGEINGEPDPALFARGLASFKAHYAAHLAVRTQPYPGVVDVLEQLSLQGFVLGCVTNKLETFTRALLEQLDLARYFRVVVAGDTVPARKPDPLPLRHACEQVRGRAERAVLVGDSANDVLAARAAGMHCIAVTYGYSQGRDLRALQPDRVVDSAPEVLQHLRLHD